MIGTRNTCMLLLLMILIGCQTVPVTKRRPYLAPTARGALIGAAGGAVLGAPTLVGGPVGAVIGGVTGSVVGNNMEANQVAIVNVRDQLAHMGVDVFSVGEDITLVLPSNVLFYPDAPRLNNDGVNTLVVVARFLDLYKKDLVKIEAFTSSKGSLHRNYALTRGQAEAVVDFLDRNTHDSRMLVAEGHGESKPMVANNEIAAALNNRVEITFRAIPIPMAQ